MTDTTRDEKIVAKRFVRAKNFIDSIQHRRYFYNGVALGTWRLFDTRYDARRAVMATGAVRWDAEEVAAWGAVYDAFEQYTYATTGMYGNWCHDLDHVIAAASVAASKAARDFITSDVLLISSNRRDDADKTAGDAARSAALMAAVCACDDLSPKRIYSVGLHHFKHAMERWNVFERGYGLYCELGGTLYVYRKPIGSMDE